MKEPSNVKIGQAAKILGVSIDTLRRWEKTGKIQAIRTPGGTRLYSLAELRKVNPNQFEPEIQAEPANLEQYFKAPTNEADTSIPATSQELTSSQITPTIRPSILKAGSIWAASTALLIITTVAGLKLLPDQTTNLLQQFPLPSFNQNLTNLEKLPQSLGSVLAASAPLNTFLEINTDTTVNGNLKINGNLTAPNILNDVLGGNNVSITSASSSAGLIKTISVTIPSQISVNGIVGPATLKAGTDISIASSSANLTLANTSTLDSVTSRGASTSNSLTLSGSNSITASTLTATGGSINGVTIGASSASTGAFTTLSTTGALSLESSSHLLSGTGVPSNSIGSNGDYYFNTSASGGSTSVYVKISGSWTAAGGGVSGTANRLAKFDSTGNALANSSISDDGTTVSTTENFSTTGTLNGLTVSSGTISSGTWNGTAIGTAYGGLGGSVTAAGAGELLYSTGTTTYTHLAAGTANYVLVANGAAAPVWTAQSGLTGVVPSFNNITSGTNTQATMTVSTGASLTYSASGTINSSSLEGNTWEAPGTIGSTTKNTGAFTTLTALPGSNSTALTLTGTNVTSSNLATLTSSNTSGNIVSISSASSTTLSGALTGINMDLDSGNLTATNQNVTGELITLPTVTNTNTSGTETYKGLSVTFGTGSGINQNGTGGATVFSNIDVTQPALTQTLGTLTANGIKINTPTSITTGGTANGLNISASGVGAGTLNGINISNITTLGGTQTAVSIGSGWNNVLTVNGTNIINGSGVTQVAGGGTGDATLTQNGVLYGNATSAAGITAAGTTGQVLIGTTGSAPSWGTISGSTCTDCVVTDPSSSQTITPTSSTATGLIVKQASSGSVDIFDICANANCTGSNKYFSVDSSGNVSTGAISNTTLTLTPTSDTTALTLVGTNVATSNLQYINSKNSSGTILNMAYGAAQTLSTSTALTGFAEDLSTNVTATNSTVAGQTITLPSPTDTHTSGTKTLRGLVVTAGGGLNQNGAGGTLIFSGADITIPALTQTAGTITGNGVLVTTPSSITTGGTANGINISASGVGTGGVLNGINISGITAGAGTQTAIAIGNGWNTGISVGTLSSATSLGLTIGALSGTTADTGISIGALSGSGATNTGITIGNISGTGTTDYGIQLGTLTGGTTSNYQIQTGNVTAIASATNAGLVIGTTKAVTGTAASSTNYGINIEPIDSTGTTNYGLYVGSVSGATSNYAAIFAGGNVGIGTTAPGGTLDVRGNVLVNGATQIIDSGNQLSVKGISTGNNAGYVVAQDGSATVTAYLGVTNSAGFLGTYTNTQFTLRTNNTDKIFITTSGRLGIGVAPGDEFGNTTSNVTDQGSTGTTGGSGITWINSAAGYITGLENSSSASNANGLLVDITGTATTNKVLTLNSNGTDLFSVEGNGVASSVSTNATGATTSSSFNITDSSLTTGTLAYLNSSSITTGKLLDIATSLNTWTGNGTTNGLVNVTSTSTAGTGSSSDILLNLSRSGTNSNSSHTAYGLYSSVSNSGTSSTDVGGFFTTSNAATQYAIQTGNLTAASSGTTYGINIGTSTGASSATFGSINTGAISGAGTTSYGINLGANSSTATTNYGINIGAISGAGTTNYGINIGAVSGATTNYDIKGANWNVTPAGALTVASCSGCGGGSRLDQITAATTTSTIDSTSNAIAFDWNSLTTQTGFTVGDTASGGSLTTGTLLAIGSTSSKYVHTTAETGSLVTLGFSDESTNTSGATTTNGLILNSKINTSGAGTKSINVIDIAAPTSTACTTGACTWTGFNLAAPGALSNTTYIGAAIGALSGTTANTGVSIGAISGSGATGTGITVGNISSTGTTDYGIQLGTLTGGTTSNYQIQTGNVTAIASATNAGLVIGTTKAVTGTAASSTNYGINIEPIDSTGTTNYGINIGAVSGATTNYDIKGANWNVLASGAITDANLNTSNGIVYSTNSSGLLGVTAAGGAGTLCLVETAGGAPTFSACSGSTSTSWSSLSAPSANLTLAMAGDLTTFTFNSVTSGSAFTMSSSSLTTGKLLNLTSDSLTTGNLIYLSSAGGVSGNGLISVNTSAQTTGAAVGIYPTYGNDSAGTGFGIDLEATDAQNANNVDYGVYSLLTNSGSGAKSLNQISANVIDTGTGASQITDMNMTTTSTGTMTSGTKRIKGNDINISSVSSSSGGTINVYGVYAQASGTVAAGGTINSYGLYVATKTAAGSFSTNGTSSYTGLYVTSPNNSSGGDAASTQWGAQLGGDINLFGSNETDAHQTVFFGPNSVAAPGANSAGEKIQLYGTTAGTRGADDLAIGANSSILWFNTSASTTAGKFQWFGNSTQVLQLDGAGNLVPDTGALSTSATNGFIYSATSAGTPTGVPTTFTGRAAFEYDTTNNKFYVYNGGWKTTTAFSDYAEWAPAAGADIGDIVTTTDQLNPTPDDTAPFMLGKSATPYDNRVIGVVSKYAEEGNQAYGFKKSSDYHAIALVGRVPVKVSTINGPISQGDFLTSSSIPGVAMKATQTGEVIGKAMEDYFNPDPNAVTEIIAFIQPSQADPSQVLSNIILDDSGNIILPKAKTNHLELSGVNEIKLATLEDSLDPSILSQVGDAVSSGSDTTHVDLATTINTIVAAQNQIQDQVNNLSSNEASSSAQIAGLSNQISSQSSQIASQSAELSSHSDLLSSITQKINDLIASPSANLSLTPTTLIASDSAQLNSLSTDTATVSTTLKSLGDSFLGNTTIAGDLSVDGTFSINNGSEINALPILHFQTNALAEGVDFFNGLVSIDKTGTLSIQKLSVIGPTIGSSTIPAGQTSVTIQKDQILSTDKVFLTPKSSTLGQTIFVSQINDHSFTVNLDHSINSDINFDYWIVGTK